MRRLVCASTIPMVCLHVSARAEGPRIAVKVLPAKPRILTGEPLPVTVACEPGDQLRVRDVFLPGRSELQARYTPRLEGADALPAFESDPVTVEVSVPFDAPKGLDAFQDPYEHCHATIYGPYVIYQRAKRLLPGPEAYGFHARVVRGAPGLPWWTRPPGNSSRPDDWMVPKGAVRPPSPPGPSPSMPTMYGFSWSVAATPARFPTSGSWCAAR